MSAESWQDDNNQYLAASLRWLRLRLQRLLRDQPPPAASEAVHPTVATPVEKPGRLSRWFAADAPPASEAPARLLIEAKPPPLEERLKEADAAREAAGRTDPPPALLLLAERLGLSPFERDTLFLCAAVEFDPGLAALYGRVQGNPARSHPTFGLALSVLDDPTWDAVSAHRPIRHARLVEITQPGGTPLTSSPLRADERIVNYLKGLNVLDERLATLLTPLEGGEAELSTSQQAVAETIIHRLHDAVAEAVVPVVQLVGRDVGSKVAVARQVCATVNRRLYRMGAEALPPHVSDIETLSRLWQRETLLLPVALHLDAENVEGAPADAQNAFHRFLSRAVGLVFVGVRETPIRFSGLSFPVEVAKPAATEQFEAWRVLLGAGTADAGSEVGNAAAVLAGQFDLNLAEIRRIASLAAKASDRPGTVGERAWDTCRDLARPQLDALAQRLDVKATWDDLVLADEQMALMRQIAGQVRERHKVYGEWGFAQKMNRGFGISALFAGESGTGKTMAAEVIASDLRLHLYRIDLSAVVSKYIGETEKNLRQVFDAAEQGGAILFFDEADALFGKRSEVKDSHDRYANIEINYLLQRMEAFSGLAILATNMKAALDPAFMRRLRFIVNLRFPGVKERTAMWKKALPVATPKESLDYERLARLNLTGGNIHSIALNAAFLAAQTRKPVSMPLILSAARTELQKLDKAYSEMELR